MDTQYKDPRYEFRLFGQTFGPLVDYVERSHQPVSRQEESDTYLLAPTNPDYSVKVRHGKLDTKLLMRRERGLERWHPHLQIDFPLTKGLLREFVFSWLQVDLPPLLRASYTVQQFLQEAVAATPTLRVVKVHKQRRQYNLYNCQVEVGELCINDTIDVRTIAVEGPQLELVTRTLQILDLQDYQNTNYVAGLLQMTASQADQHATQRTGHRAQQPPAPVREPVFAR